MKILPYSVLAATLLGGGVGMTPRNSVPSGIRLRSVSSVPQNEPKSASTAGPEAPGNGDESKEFPAGTTIYAELTKAIDVKKAKAGDAIVAHVTLPVLLRGKIAIQNDAKIMGHVTEAVALPGTDGRSRLGVLFDRVTLKDGTKAGVALTVQAVGWHASKGSGDDAGQLGEAELHTPLSHPPTSPGVHMQSGQTGQGGTHGTAGEETSPMVRPTLDAGSHGAIGMPDVKLIESKDAGQGSVIESEKRNVRLESETELVLRVIAAGDEGTGKL